MLLLNAVGMCPVKKIYSSVMTCCSLSTGPSTFRVQEEEKVKNEQRKPEKQEIEGNGSQQVKHLRYLGSKSLWAKRQQKSRQTEDTILIRTHIEDSGAKSRGGKLEEIKDEEIEYSLSESIEVDSDKEVDNNGFLYDLSWCRSDEWKWPDQPQVSAELSLEDQR